MTNEYNTADDGVGYIDGEMELGTESPLEDMNENKNVTKMNESQFRNLVYETVLKILDEQLNEDDPMAAGAAPTGQTMAGGATIDPAAAGGMAIAAPEDVDKSPYKERADKEKQEIAKKVGDNSGGAPGFSPQGPDDEQKKQMAKQVAESVLRQLKKEFSKKK